MVRGADRALQGAARRAVRHGVSDDRLRQGAEVQAPGRTRTGTSEDPGILKRPPSDLDLTDDVPLRNGTPVAAVRAVVPVVAHHEIVALLDRLGSVIVVAAEFVGHVVVA